VLHWFWNQFDNPESPRIDVDVAVTGTASRTQRGAR
jgi:hypothetical protein